MRRLLGIMQCVVCYEPVSPLISPGCACRADNGIVHLECLVRKAICQQSHRGNCVWSKCQTCNQDFTGAMRLGLASAWLQWVDEGQHARCVDSDYVFSVEHDVDNGTEAMAARKNMAESLLIDGAYAQAEPMLHALYEQLAETYGVDDVRTSEARLNWAYTIAGQGRLSVAESHIRAVLGSIESHDANYVNSTLGNLAYCVRLQGRYVESESIEREVLVQHRREFGDEHQFTLTTQVNLAHSLYGQCRYAEAMELLCDALLTIRRVFGVEHPLTAETARTQCSWRAGIHRSRKPQQTILQSHRLTRRLNAFHVAIATHGWTDQSQAPSPAKRPRSHRRTRRINTDDEQTR